MLLEVNQESYDSCYYNKEITKRGDFCDEISQKN